MIRAAMTAVILVGVSLGWRLSAAEPPRVLELRTQAVEGVTYFHVRLEQPADLRLPAFDTHRPFSESDRRKFASLPRLVPQDAATRAVYYRHKPTQPSLSFRGQTAGGGKARLLLLYPTDAQNETIASLLELDFTKAQAVAIPPANAEDQHLHRDDLRSHWGLYQAAHFAVLETQVLDFSFYSFAREATGRKYGVVAPAWVKREIGEPQHRLYEITTGADAIAETLQLHRLLQPEIAAAGERTVDILHVGGVAVPEQPSDRLLADKRPAVEPLARLVPHDNYYVYFQSVARFIEAGDLLDQWGTSLLRVYEMKSRDLALRQRYERQLCLKSTALAKTLGPALVKGLAVTGSDPYVREGTDITIVFHVVNRPLFLAAIDGFIQEARLAHRDRLTEGREEYEGVTIEKFVTPLREVSLHRAAVADFVIYSNSPAGVRRVIDTHAERANSLANSNDLRYMRSVFPPGEKSENGFVFLSDAFIRRLTGPATRIKEKRRLEALTSMTMLTNAALFCAWETGKLPASHEAALTVAGLRPAEVAVPEGRGIRWDAEKQLALSDAYNTLHFATPLVELPIDKVTAAEAKEYASFRDEYVKLWRTYFDPIGLRLAFDDKKIRIETHILPLVGSEQYRQLRSLAGGATFQFVPRPGAVVDFLMSVGEKQTLAFQLDANVFLREMVALLICWEAEPGTNLRQEYDRLFWKLPLGVALLGNRGGIVETDEALVSFLQSTRIVEDDPQKSRYKEATIHKLAISPERYREAASFLSLLPEQPFTSLFAILPIQEAPPAFFIAGTDQGVHISANEDFLKKLIDRAQARKKDAKEPPAANESNAAMFLGLANAREAAGLLLENEAHHLALLNNNVLNCFHQTGILPPDADDKSRQATVRKFLGFAPVSADGSAYHYDARLREVANRRHGTYHRPQTHSDVQETSELGKLLNEFKALRAELRFHDNGLHTVLTIDRR
jgi:hypothetical protein